MVAGNILHDQSDSGQFSPTPCGIPEDRFTCLLIGTEKVYTTVIGLGSVTIRYMAIDLKYFK